MPAHMPPADNSFWVMMMMMFLFTVALPLGIGVPMLFLLTAFGVPDNVALPLTAILTVMLFAGGLYFVKSWCWQRWNESLEEMRI